MIENPPATWDCMSCGQKNSGYAIECGRCEGKRLNPVLVFKAARRLALAVDLEVRQRTIDARSPAGDALLDFAGILSDDPNALAKLQGAEEEDTAAAALARMRVPLLWFFGTTDPSLLTEQWARMIDKPAPALAQLREEVLAWQAETFTQRTLFSITSHLKREALEVMSAPLDAEEYGDAQLLLWAAQAELDAMAAGYGIDVEAAARAKLAKNKLRTWGQPDHEGVVSHTAEASSCPEAYGQVKHLFVAGQPRCLCGKEVAPDA